MRRQSRYFESLEELEQGQKKGVTSIAELEQLAIRKYKDVSPNLSRRASLVEFSRNGVVNDSHRREERLRAQSVRFQEDVRNMDDRTE